MKNLILAAFVVALSFSSAFAQKLVKTDAKGNFYEPKAAVAKLTTKTYTSKAGVVYRVWLSPKGKYFVNICPSSGKWYKKYLN